MSESLYVTTVLEFEDRYEGQVLHEGDKESCNRLMNILPAISTSGPETPKAARLQIIAKDKFPPDSLGMCWRIAK